MIKKLKNPLFLCAAAVVAVVTFMTLERNYTLVERDSVADPIASQVIKEHKENYTFSSEDSKLADFGRIAASGALSYVTSVEKDEETGNSVVSVVVSDKLCKVTVQGGVDDLKAAMIECEKRDYSDQLAANVSGE